MYVGIALGSQDSLHQWVFAATAGMFLYIALVDLVSGKFSHPPDPGMRPHFNTSCFGVELSVVVDTIYGLSIMLVSIKST